MPSAVEDATRPRRKAKGTGTVTATAESVLFRHPSGARARRVKVGFAWDLFLFAGVFGVPLFLRGLPDWGAAVLGLWIADLYLGWAGPGAVRGPGEVALFVAFLGLQLWLGLKGNAMTARTWHGRGWAAMNPREPGVRQALRRWGIEGE